MTFIYLESDEDVDDDDDDEEEVSVWRCMMKDCDAGIRVDDESLCVVEYLNDHNCLPSLQLLVYAELDGHVFCRVSGIPVSSTVV